MKKATQSHQRYFGISVLAAMLMLAWFAHRTLNSPVAAGIIAGVGAILTIGYYLVPTIQPTAIRLFLALTFPVRWVLTIAVLGIVYYLVLTPIAIWYRWSGKSIRKVAPNSQTNWDPIKMSSEAKTYFRTF